MAEHELNEILLRLKQGLKQAAGRFDRPYLYLDPEGVNALFQEFTGLSGPPQVRIEVTGASDVEVSLESGRAGVPPALPLLFESLAPLLRQRLILVSDKTALKESEPRYVWVSGRLEATHFPDGNLNLEIRFAGVRGVLFYTPAFFSSVIRPFLAQDRIHTLTLPVEALVFVHGPVKRQIFYHLTYGDNEEHDWLPLVPLMIRQRPEDVEP
jgi:hypothetical protein